MKPARKAAPPPADDGTPDEIIQLMKLLARQSVREQAERAAGADPTKRGLTA